MAIRLRQEGEHDFVVLERSDADRRHLARQLVPGLRRRRRVPPLLVLVRAEPGVDAASTRRSAEIWDYQLRARGGARARPRTCASATRSSAPTGTPRRACGTCRPRARPGRRALPHLGHGPARRTRSPPRHPRPGELRRDAASTPRAGTTTTTSRASASPSIGTGSSAAQFVPEIAPRRRAAARLPAHPGVGPAAHEPAHHRRRSARLYRRFPARSAPCATSRCCGTSCSACCCAARAARRSSSSGSAARTCGARSRTRRCARSSRRRYRAGCKRLIIADDWYPALARPERRRRHRRDHGGAAARASSPPTARVHEVDTLILGTGFEIMPVADPLRGRDGVALAERWARAPRGLPRHDGRGLPELLHARRARTPRRATRRSCSTPRRRSSTCSSACGTSSATARGRSRSARSRSTRSRRRSASSCRGPSGSSAGATPGTSTSAAGPRCCGPATTWEFNAAPAAARPVGLRAGLGAVARAARAAGRRVGAQRVRRNSARAAFERLPAASVAVSVIR